MDGMNNLHMQALKKDGIVSEINNTQSLAVFFCNIWIRRDSCCTRDFSSEIFPLSSTGALLPVSECRSIQQKVPSNVSVCHPQDIIL